MSKVAPYARAAGRRDASSTAGVVEGPAVSEIVQVMKWIGFDGAKAERVAAQIGGRLRDFAAFSHSEV
jgi:hypothetical protein